MLDQPTRLLLYGLLGISALYIVFTSSVSITVLMIVLFCMTLFMRNKKLPLLAIAYLLPWEKLTPLPFFSGISIIILIYSVVCFVSLLQNKIRVRDLIAFVVLFAIGVFALFKHRSFSGILMSACMLISADFRMTLKRDESIDKFIRLFFFFIFVSGFMSGLYGLFNTFVRGNMTNMYMGEGYFLRVGGTLGIDRSCMLYCVALVYPLFYMKKVTARILSVIVFVAFTLLTMSLTAVVCLGALTIIYFLWSYRRNRSKKRLGWIVFIILLLLCMIYVWENGSGIDAVDSMILRIRRFIDLTGERDYVKATSNRTEIWKSYMDIYRSSSTAQKLFGTWIPDYDAAGLMSSYAHNTYIDILLYMGLIPMAVMLFRCFSDIILLREKTWFTQFLVLKIVYLITAASVTMMTNVYWWMLFLL